VNGTEPIPVGKNGETRGFIQDGDELTIRGWANSKGAKIGFGAATGTILPASTGK
jgi:fumarylacetoacetase